MSFFTNILNAAIENAYSFMETTGMVEAEPEQSFVEEIEEYVQASFYVASLSVIAYSAYQLYQIYSDPNYVPNDDADEPFQYEKEALPELRTSNRKGQRGGLLSAFAHTVGLLQQNTPDTQNVLTDDKVHHVNGYELRPRKSGL